MRKIKYLIIFLVGTPLFGLFVGYVFFSLLNLVNGPLNDMAFRVSLVVWGMAGLVAGVYGVIPVLKMPNPSFKRDS